MAPLKARIRFNNYALSLPILRSDKDSHLPSSKGTGWHGSSVREYEYWDDLTVERTTKSVIFHLRQNYAIKVFTEGDFDRAVELVKKRLADAVVRFMDKYPGIELDISRQRIIQREVEIKHPTLRNELPRDMVFHDTISKKVYKREGSFEMKGEKAESHAKNFITNMALRDMSPAFVEAFEKYAAQIELHLEATRNWNESAKSLKASIDRLAEGMVPWYVRLWRRIR